MFFLLESCDCHHISFAAVLFGVMSHHNSQISDMGNMPGEAAMSFDVSLLYSRKLMHTHGTIKTPMKLGTVDQSSSLDSSSKQILRRGSFLEGHLFQLCIVPPKARVPPWGCLGPLLGRGHIGLKSGGGIARNLADPQIGLERTSLHQALVETPRGVEFCRQAPAALVFVRLRRAL